MFMEPVGALPLPHAEVSATPASCSRGGSGLLSHKMKARAGDADWRGSAPPPPPSATTRERSTNEERLKRCCQGQGQGQGRALGFCEEPQLSWRFTCSPATPSRPLTPTLSRALSFLRHAFFSVLRFIRLVFFFRARVKGASVSG